MTSLEPRQGRRMLRLQALPRKRTLLGLGALAYVLTAARPVALVGFGTVAAWRALAGGRCGKREG
ncbi:MAG: hypothetical protein EBX49_06745 [Synechococcaceae bacterium WB8_1B_136]|nr:hypothetical protein [Synechococcaceae bacterium WB8_1B_136]